MAIIKIPRKLACIFLIFLTILIIQLIISLTFYNISELGDPRSSHPYKTEKSHNHLPSSGENIKKTLSPKSTNGNYSSPCGVLPKDANRAISRAKTAKCKKELTEIACLAKKDELYPKEIPNFCSLEKLPHNSVNLPSSSTLPEPIRIAFILSLNNRSLRQILRLFSRIYDSKHFYLIHVDKRRNYLFHELKEHLKGFSNVYFSKNRMSTIWGGFSFLEMLIESMKELLKLSGWDFVINLSESDYPVKPLRRLEQFLGLYKRYNFVRATSQNLKKFVSKQGLDRTFYQCEDRVWRLGPRTIPRGLKISGGSDWFCLTREFCEYVSHGDDAMLREVRTLFKYSLLASESFFHTVLQNSHFCDSIVDNNLRLVNWKREKGCKCQYKNVVDWCGCSPNDFTSDDWSRIQETSAKPTFFARKFESIIDQTILNKIDHHLINNGTQFLDQNQLSKYWQNEYHDAYDRRHDEKRSFYTILSLMASKMLSLTCERFHNGGEFLELSESLDLYHLLEVTLFFENDKYHGTLIDNEYKLSRTESPFTFEIFARPIVHIQYHQSFENATVQLKVMIMTRKKRFFETLDAF
ncbi:xylosyltransferase oxt isoform X2 [Brevipalpus obovatus]|uniref:xylosyltransferase oxt isoform X2 n=1 Tax=Brevipalpus obovatus TaxID=246614 RepID=UPI003D9F10CA